MARAERFDWIACWPCIGSGRQGGGVCGPCAGFGLRVSGRRGSPADVVAATSNVVAIRAPTQASE